LSVLASKIAEGTPLFLAYGGCAFLPVGAASLMVTANKIVASNTGEINHQQGVGAVYVDTRLFDE
jgi:hypothetical protein